MRVPRSNPFSLRALVKAAQVISAPPEVSRSPHVLGLGISTRNTYRVSEAVYRLPTTDAGIAHLRSSTAVAVPGLPLEYSDGAWGALLGKPQLVVDLPSIQVDDFLVAGQVLPQDLEEGTLRGLGLAVVAMPDSVELTTERELVATPVAGIAQLVLATRKRVDTSADAWIIARWYDSAEETAAALEKLYTLSAARLPGSLPASAVLLTDSDDAWSADELDEQITSCAALLDYQITGYKPKDYIRKALAHAKRTPPDILLVADSSTARCESVVEAYLATPKARGLKYLESGDISALISGIRKRLIVASGVSLNLLSIAQPTVQQPEKLKGRLPIQKEGRRLHHARHGIYIECEVSGYFYVIDTARHAGVVSKRYVFRADGLHWDADLDANGEVIENKFKGKIGRFIPRNELNPG